LISGAGLHEFPSGAAAWRRQIPRTACLCFYPPGRALSIETRNLSVIAKTPNDQEAMSKVKVYQYTILDLKRVERRKSRRWGTREGIQSLSDLTEIIEGTGVEVDASAVDSLGFTTLDFDPRSADADRTNGK